MVHWSLPVVLRRSQQKPCGRASMGIGGCRAFAVPARWWRAAPDATMRLPHARPFGTYLRSALLAVVTAWSCFGPCAYAETAAPERAAPFVATPASIVDQMLTLASV